MTPDRTCQQWADELMTYHAKFFRKEPNGAIPTAFIIEDASSGDYGVISCGDMEDDCIRAALYDALRDLLSAPVINRYAFIGEVHSCACSTGATCDQVLTIVCDRRLPKPLALFQRIIRDHDGAVRALSDPEEPQLMGGPVVELFERQNQAKLQ
jgi:hypothetical protein